MKESIVKNLHHRVTSGKFLRFGGAAVSICEVGGLR